MQSRNGIGGGSGNEDFFARREEGVKTGPPITENRGTAGGSFEETARRAEAHGCHGGASDVQRERR